MIIELIDNAIENKYLLIEPCKLTYCHYHLYYFIYSTIYIISHSTLDG